MSLPPTNQEPPTAAGPVRRFKDPAYQPMAETLGELRQEIDELDSQIITLLAQRGRCVRDATRFKLDAFQVAAPSRQAEVFLRVRTLAEQSENAFPNFADIIEPTYRTLVAGFIAGEAHCFQDTERTEP
mgnify:CR=1 FL=1